MILYKHCGAEGGLKCLDSEKIWLARPRSFNDPFDVLPHIETRANRVKAKNGVEINTSDIVVLCLAERIDSPSMWAHYANSHSGLLIGFNRRGRIIEDGLLFRKFGAVSYSHYRPSAASFEDLSDDKIYFRKSSEWTYEREWRLVTSTVTDHGTKVDDDHWSFQMFPRDVVTIVVGHRGSSCFPKLYEILRRSQYEHVTLQIAVPHPKNFELIINEWPRDKWEDGKPPTPMVDTSFK